MDEKIECYVIQYLGKWIDSEGNSVTIAPYEGLVNVLNPDGKYDRQERMVHKGRLYASEHDAYLKYWNKESEKKLIDKMKLFIEKRWYSCVGEYTAKNILSKMGAVLEEANLTA